MRFELQPRKRGKYICFVGYDRTNQSFYVYVASKGSKDRSGKLAAGESNHVVMWLGGEAGSIYGGEFCAAPHEIKSVDEVKELIGEFAELPEEVERSLRSCVTEEQGIEGRRGAA